MPIAYIKLLPPRKLTDKQKETLRERAQKNFGSSSTAVEVKSP